MYGRFINGVFEAAPVNFMTEDGITICNFDRDTDKLSRYGFKEVQSQPMPDLAYNQTAEPVYTEDEQGNIIESWNIITFEDIPNPEDDFVEPEEIIEPVEEIVDGEEGLAEELSH